MTAFEHSRLVLLDEMLSGSTGAAIVVHSHPDGDALGSSLALMRYLRETKGSAARVIVPDRPPKSLSFLYEEDEILVYADRPSAASEVLNSCDLLICLDLNAFNRTAEMESVLSGLKCRKLLIDHHLNPDRNAFDLVFSETEISSTCELLFWLLMEMPDIKDASSLPARAASALMAGMTTDTNNFANSVFPGTLEMASLLLGAGVDRDSLLANLYNCYRENRLRAQGYFLSEKMTVLDNGVAYAVFSEEDRKRFGLLDGETEGFVNLPLGIEQVGMSLFLREEGVLFRVSIRSKKGWSANRLAAAYFHGGGHECAAGGKLFKAEGILSAGDAERYVEEVTARFLQDSRN